MQQSSKKTTDLKRGKSKLDLREQLGAFRNLPEFFLLIWSCDKFLTVMNIILRVIRASLPLTMLYVGKLIIDEIVSITETVNGLTFEDSKVSVSRRPYQNALNGHSSSV